MEFLKEKMKFTDTNEEFLISMNGITVRIFISNDLPCQSGRSIPSKSRCSSAKAPN